MKAGVQALALAVMTPLFFCPAISPFINQVLWSFGDPLGMRIPLSAMMFNIPALAFIALCGAMVFLAATRKGNPSWYLGIPLACAYAIIAASPVYAGFFVIHDPSPPLYHPGVIMGILAAYGIVFLLPPCAALFFWSQRQRGRGAALMSGIALLITLNSLILTFFILSPYLVSAGFLPAPQPHYIDGHPVKTDGEGLLFLFIHLMIGLPLLGIGFLALAAFIHYRARREISAPLPHFPEIE